jgi:hypothetical protein
VIVIRIKTEKIILQTLISSNTFNNFIAIRKKSSFLHALLKCFEQQKKERRLAARRRQNCTSLFVRAKIAERNEARMRKPEISLIVQQLASSSLHTRMLYSLSLLLLLPLIASQYTLLTN